MSKENFLAQYGSADHLTDLLQNSKDATTREKAMANPLINHSHLTQAVNDKNWYVREAAAKHKDATEEHLTKLLHDTNSYVGEAAVLNKNNTPKTLHIAAQHEDHTVRYHALRHSKLSSDSIYHVIESEPHPAFRHKVLDHPNITNDHLVKAAKDPNKEVAAYAQKKLDAPK